MRSIQSVVLLAAVPALLLFAAPTHAQWVTDTLTVTDRELRAPSQTGGGTYNYAVFTAPHIEAKATAALSSGSYSSYGSGAREAVYTQTYRWNGGGTATSTFTVPTTVTLSGYNTSNGPSNFGGDATSYGDSTASNVNGGAQLSRSCGGNGQYPVPNSTPPDTGSVSANVQVLGSSPWTKMKLQVDVSAGGFVSGGGSGSATSEAFSTYTLGTPF